MFEKGKSYTTEEIENKIRQGFFNLICGEGLLVPRIAVRILVDSLFREPYPEPKQEDMGKIFKIEVEFPIGVDVTVARCIDLDKVIRNICEENCPGGYVMWPAGQGQKITYMVMTAEEERERDKKGLSPIEFDSSIFSITCAIKEK